MSPRYSLILLLACGCNSSSNDLIASYGDLNQQISAYKAAIQTLNDKLDSLDETCAKSDDMDSLANDVDALERDLSTRAAQDGLDTLADRVGTTETELVSLSERLTDDEVKLVELWNTRVTWEEYMALTGRVNRLSNDISSNTGRIITAETYLSTLQGDSLALQVQQALHTTLLGDHGTAISDLQTVEVVTTSRLTSVEDDLSTETTWTVGATAPADYATIQAAIDATAEQHIAPGGALTIVQWWRRDSV
jgi:chromosome segregation ATPase